MKKGCKYGTHRVIEPANVLPQPATKISNDMEIHSNEILIDVQALNIDSASFTQIEEECNLDLIWESLDERASSTISVINIFDLDDDWAWDDSIEWQLETAKKLYNTFSNRIKEFNN